MRIKLILIIIVSMFVSALLLAYQDYDVYSKKPGEYKVRWVPFSTMLEQSQTFANQLSHSSLTNLEYSVSGHTGFMSDSGDVATGNYTFNGKIIFTKAYASVVAAEPVYSFSASSSSFGVSGSLRNVYINTESISSDIGGAMNGLFITANNKGSGRLGTMRGAYVYVANSYASSGPDNTYGIEVSSNPAPGQAMRNWNSYKAIMNLNNTLSSTDYSDSNYYSEIINPSVSSFSGTADVAGFHSYVNSTGSKGPNNDGVLTIYGYLAELECSYYDNLFTDTIGIPTEVGLGVITKTTNYSGTRLHPMTGIYSDIPAGVIGTCLSAQFKGAPVIVGEWNNNFMTIDDEGDLAVEGNLEVLGNVKINGDVTTVTSFITITTDPIETVTGGPGYQANINLADYGLDASDKFIITNVEVWCYYFVGTVVDYDEVDVLLKLYDESWSDLAYVDIPKKIHIYDLDDTMRVDLGNGCTVGDSTVDPWGTKAMVTTDSAYHDPSIEIVFGNPVDANTYDVITSIGDTANTYDKGAIVSTIATFTPGFATTPYASSPFYSRLSIQVENDSLPGMELAVRVTGVTARSL